MAKFKVGDVVRHKGTGDNLLILHVRCPDACMDNKAIPQQYVVRLPNYERTSIEEFELERIQDRDPMKIQDSSNE